MGGIVFSVSFRTTGSVATVRKTLIRGDQYIRMWLLRFSARDMAAVAVIQTPRNY